MSPAWAPSRPAYPGQAARAGASSPDGHGRLGAKDYALAAGAQWWVLAGGLVAKHLLDDPHHMTALRIAAARLDERIDKVEQKVGRVAWIKEYLREMDVKDRVDRVEKQIRRAGTTVRAKETGRPRWMVRLADAIGGRWSNL